MIALTSAANAFEVWSGEFFVETSDETQIGFVGTFVANEAECRKSAIQGVVGHLTFEEFSGNATIYMIAAQKIGDAECK